MRGRARREGERNFTVPRRSISWHMQPTVISVDSTSFFKDGRKISIGDCALFKPPQDSPPFIGLIRCLTLDKENNLLLGVNWLYRPAELNLGKGALLDCAPNEVFYSFHKDTKILAASLLHPCKVAFLPRGAELPKGASSFVCRRVYDIANKRLWWLTDQHYVNEQQEELDRLLYKTRIEMHATLQPGGRSPKQGNCPTSASQMKSGPENIQNGPTSFNSQVKGKKRERGDHAAEPVKRERFSRTDDGDSTAYRPENHLKSDIARITEKGGVVDVEGVEKLVQLMQPDRMEKKMDLVSRSMLAGVIASTDKVDCLTRFVQLRGLPVLDEWLQDIHKGKVGDNNSSKDADKSVEEFLLVLLRALDKIPVNLHALQMCNIGRSVNHLRSHKNLEIQRKARGLVDTWKKRVEAEMNSIDAKSSSAQSAWPSKSRLPEASHGVCRSPSGSEIAMKSSITQHSGSKTASIKASHGESNTKSSSSSPGPMKPALSPASCKESHPKTFVGGATDLPLIREDKSSSSNQSQSNSQSITGKEDGKGSTAASASGSKISSSSSRIRKNSGGSQGVTGGQKENCSSRSSSSYRSNALDKLQSTSTGERVLEVCGAQASNHKLIVKIPNRVPSPPRGISGGSIDDPTILNGQASSPPLSDKHELFDHNLKEKSDAYRFSVSSNINVDSSLNDTKDVLNGSGDGDGPPTILPDEEHSMTTEDSRSLLEGTKTDRLRSRMSHETSFSPMNALLESCVKYSEAHSSLSLEDDVGMNLLASVATGEMSRSDMVSPDDSADRSSPAVEEVRNADEVKSKSSPEGHDPGGRSPVCYNGENDDKKKTVFEGSSWAGDGLHSADGNYAPSHASADILAGEGNKKLDSVSTDRGTVDQVQDISDKPYGKADINKKIIGGEANKEMLEGKAPSTNVCLDYDSKVPEDLLNANEAKLVVEVASSDQLFHDNCKSDANEGDCTGTNPKLKSTTAMVKSDVENATNGKLVQTSLGSKLKSETGDEIKVEGIDRKDKNWDSNVEEKVGTTPGSKTGVEGQIAAGSASAANDLRTHLIDDNVERKDIVEQITSPKRGFSTSVAHEAHKNKDLVGSASPGIESDEADSASAVAESSSSSAAAASNADGKIKFDLNEGFTVDDGKYGGPVDLPASVSTTVQMVNPLPLVVNSVHSGHPASVTVAAAAKGPFVPPDDLLRSKGELGWKGSAATSAFRPAEPRKAVETPLASRSSPSDASTSKQGRVLLDFDLNVPDERVLEELSSRNSALSIDHTAGFVSNRTMLLNENSVSVPVIGSGGLDLDLNRADEVNEKELCSTSSDNRREGSLTHIKPLGVLPAADVRRDFDLNDGPGADDSSSEHVAISQQFRAGTPSQLLPRMNYAGLGSLSSWFPSKNTFSTVTIPSMIPERVDQTYPVIPAGAPHRTIGPAGVTAFTPDVYRGSVLSSSPAMSFPSSPFQYSVFPFGATFPLPSATFPVGATSYTDSSSGPRLFAPPMNSHLLGPVGAVSSQFQRPYVVSLPDSSSNGGSEGSRKWVRQGLDLNAGPGATDSEARDDLLPLSSNQQSVAGSQALAEEHARMYAVSGGIMKRKEPEGGWDGDSFRYKQPSWQ